MRRNNLVELHERKIGSLNIKPNTNIVIDEPIEKQLSEDTSFVFDRGYDDISKINEYFNSQNDMYVNETSINKEVEKSNILKYVLIGILIFLGISYLTRR